MYFSIKELSVKQVSYQPNPLNIKPFISVFCGLLKNNIYSVIGMGLLFVIVQVIALVIAPIYSEAESEALGGRETIENPSFAFLYLGIILLVTFVILIIAKRKKEKFIKILILAAIFMTMVYLFIPLTITIMYPPSDDGFQYNEIGFTVTALNAADVDDDGIIEVVAGCSDHKIRVYESENHTLEWESDELNANITQILIGNYDADDTSEIVVFTGAITVYDGINQSIEYSSAGENLQALTGADLNHDNINELIVGTQDVGGIEVLEFYALSNSINLSPTLESIEFLEATDDGLIVAADNSTIILVNSTTSDIELQISELEEIRALTVYSDPKDEDYIIAADENRPYLFNHSSSEHIRQGPEFGDIEAIHLEHYSISDFNDSIPDVITVGEKTIYISPDLLKSEKGYYFLRFKYNLYSFLSTDLEGDGSKEIIIGTEDGYRFTTITFGEGANLAIPFVISIVLASLLTFLVHKFPEWYVVDGVGLVMAVGATVILGVTFAILPAIVLLIILAVYDAISVYKTKHMITLADSVIDLNLPVLLVIPKKRGYSFREPKPRLKEQLDSGKEREAMFMGLGDIVIPSLLIVSSLSFLPSSQGWLGVSNNLLVAIGTMIGILFGFSILMRFVMKGNPQAGLPLLNSGAIGGYLISYLLVFQELSFGFNLNFMGL
jgi:presenilin-like A22 family membrane protease